MHRNTLLALLENYTPVDLTERTMLLDTIRFVRDNPLCFDRTLCNGHITASAWVVSPDRKRVLLMYHTKLQRWFQPGGHCDGDPDVLHVAKKEAFEETAVPAWSESDAIFDIDIHRIPANQKEEAHDHYDIRFLLYADPAMAILNNSESREVRWVEMENVGNFNDSESILRMQRKTILIV